MPVVTLSSLQNTGQFVSADMFGANAVFAGTDNGVPSIAFADAADALGVQNIRFGGGQADLDPLKANSKGEIPVDGISSINIVEMPGGALRSEVANFLEWCAESASSGQTVKATLIIPTKHLDVSGYGAFAADIEVFVQTVMEQYGDVIAAFQIGNEYWEMGETAYGEKASIAAEAIEDGMLSAGIPEWEQPDILVQMATAGNEGSEFPSGPGAAGFAARNEAANNQIIDQLSAAARAAIDGVTEHYYYNGQGYGFSETRSDVKNIDRDYAVWEDAFDKELDLHITEWNVKTSALNHHGLVAGSTIIRQFENMIELGADGAHIWALDYHSRTALTLDTDNGVKLDKEGRLTNSAQGAVFDLMSASLIGKELISTSFSNGVPGIEISAYASSQEVVFYISSRSLDQENFILDLTPQLTNSNVVRAVKVSLDHDTTNGKQWDEAEDASSVWIDGRPYFYDEHDADVILTDMEFRDVSQISLTLNPFEVIQLTADIGAITAITTPNIDEVPDLDGLPTFIEPQEEHIIYGTDANDLINVTWNTSKIDGGAGLDRVLTDAMRYDATIGFDEVGDPVLAVFGFAQDVTLSNVERVEFFDGTLAFDTEGNSGQAYRLYQASFDRTPDAAGLEFWIQQLDGGAVSLIEAAANFITSVEFQWAYGQNDTLGNNDFISLLYANVLGRLPDQTGFDYWLDTQDNGLSRDEMLVFFSESIENKFNVAAAIDDGIWYG